MYLPDMLTLDMPLFHTCQTTCYYLTPVCITCQLMCYHLTPDMLLLGKTPCYDMTCHRTNINLLTWLVTCQISSSCHAITWHPAWHTWPVIISFTGILYLLSCITCSNLNLVLVILYYIYSDLNLQYSCTPELLIMSCTCYSRKFDNYIINHKKEQLASGRGKLAAINICSCLQWY